MITPSQNKNDLIIIGRRISDLNFFRWGSGPKQKLRSLLAVLIISSPFSARAQIQQSTWQYIGFPIMAADANGNIYVADYQNSRVDKYSRDGNLISNLISTESADGFVSQPQAITVDRNKNVFVRDQGARFQKFDSTGQYILTWGAPSPNIYFNNVYSSMTSDADGNIYVLNYRVGIEKYSNSGQLLASWPSLLCKGIASDPQGNIYAIIDDYLQKFSTNGVPLLAWGAGGSAEGQFENTVAVAADDQGNIYVADAGNSRVQKFSNAGAFISEWGGFSPLNNILVNKHANAFVIVGAYYGQAGNNSFVYQSSVDEIAILAVDSFSVTEGIPGTSVTIYGSGFSSLQNSNFLNFNGVKAEQVKINNNTSITTVIPPLATTGFISIETAESKTKSLTEFLVLPLKVTAFTPAFIAPGALVTLKGSGFSGDPTSNIVKFNDLPATVKKSSYTEIQVVAPPGISSGVISVSVIDQTCQTTEYQISKLGIIDIVSDSYFISNEAASSGAIVVNDINEIASASLKIRGVTEDDSKIQTKNIPLTASSPVPFSIESTYFNDPLGVSFYLSLKDKAGNEITSTPRYILLSYPSESADQIIPSLQHGSKVADYQLISIPLKLDDSYILSALRSLGTYDEKKWRLFAEEQGNILENPNNITAGQGYWFIMKDQHTINPGAGSVVRITPDSLFQISLLPGWNLIGNPYNFTISWSDILGYNKISPELLKFRQFIGGNLVNQDLVNRYRGAFVFTDTARTMSIPIINHTSGNRISRPQASSLDQSDWEIGLTVSDDEFSNELYGFGMNTKAKDGKDTYDEVELPMIEGLIKFSMSLRDLPGMKLIKDFVPSAENYTWIATLSSENGISIKWDNSYFGNNDKRLVIDNPEQVELINMKMANHLFLPKGNHILKFHFGDQAYIEAETLDKISRIGHVYPNPFDKKSEVLSVSVSLPEGSNQVSLMLTSLLGNGATMSGNGFYDGGRSSIEWKENFTGLAAGMYVLRIETVNNAGHPVVAFKKVIVE